MRSSNGKLRQDGRERAEGCQRLAHLNNLREPNRHADLARDDLAYRLAPRFQQIGDLLQIGGALGHGCLRPRREGVFRRPHRAVNILSRPAWHASHHLFGGRVDDIGHLGTAGGRPRAADIELVADNHLVTHVSFVSFPPQRCGEPSSPLACSYSVPQERHDI